MEFFTKYKKIFLVIGFAAMIAILGYLIYFLFFKPAAVAPIGEEPAAPGTSGFPTASVGTGNIADMDTGETAEGLSGETAKQPALPTASGGITKTEKLNETASLAGTLSANGKDLQYYSKDDEKFYRVSPDGKTTPLSDKMFHQAENISWSPDKNKAIIEYPDGSNIIYDFTADKQITLPSHWKNYNFSPDGQKIVMKSIGLDPNNRWLAIANSDGSKAQRIEALGDKDATVYPSWSPNNQTIAMYTEGAGFDRQEVYFVGLNNENFKSMTIEGRGFEPKWSSKGDKLLYSVYSSDNNLKPSLWIANAQGENIGAGRKNLNIETWADKCVFSENGNNVLFCAVPEKLEEGAGLFPEMAENTKDNLYQIDVATGLKKLIAIPDNDYTMSDLIVSDDGQYLFFTDAATGRLHKIKLK